MAKHKKQILYGIASNYLEYIISILLAILVSPLVLKYAGQETMGAYAILIQIIAYVGLIDLGFGYSTSRFLAQSNATTQDKSGFTQTLNIFRSVATIQNLIIALIFLCISIFVPRLFGFSDIIGKNVQYALWILAGWRVFSGPFGVYNGVLYATNNMYLANLISIIANMLRLVLSILFTFNNLALVGLTLAQVISQLFNIAGTLYFSNKIIGYQKFILNLKIDHRMKEIFSYSIYGFLIMIATRLIFSSDNLVIGYLFGPIAVSIYYLTAQPGIVLYQFVLRISDNFFPSITEYFVKKDLITLRKIYSRIFRFSIVLMIPISYGIIFFTKIIISFWVGSGQYLPQPMSLWFGLFAFNVILNHISGTFIKAHGRYMKHTSIVYFIEGALNFILSIILGRLLGIHAVMLASLIASYTSLVFGLIIINKILAFDFYCIKGFYLKVSFCGFILFVSHLGLSIFTIEYNMFLFLILGGVNIIMYFIFTYFLVLQSDEKKIFQEMLIKLKARSRIKLTIAS